MRRAFIKRFVSDESGAVTVDWVVLTAALVGLAIALLAVLDDEMLATAGRISDGVQTAADQEWVINPGGNDDAGGDGLPPGEDDV